MKTLSRWFRIHRAIGPAILSIAMLCALIALATSAKYPAAKSSVSAASMCPASAVFSGSFTNGQGADPATAQQWVDFRHSLVPSAYDTVTISGTFGTTGRTLTDATIVPQIAAAMKTATAFSVTAGSITWEVNIGCADNSTPPDATALIATLNGGPVGCACTGSSSYIVRPEIGSTNSNWGGVNTNTCSAPSQTITVTFSGPGLAAPPCATPPSGVVSWWPAEGDANDIQGSNDGTPVGTVTFAPGEVGQAFNFDGASGFENMGTPASLDLTNTLTLDAWINPSDSNKNGVYFGKASSSQNDYALFLLGDLTGCIKTSDGAEHFLHTGFVPPAGQWTHIALVYDGSNEIVYANGIEVGRLAVSGNIASEGIPFFIGGRNGDSPYNSLYINARIDEVEVFDRALSQAEILSIHNSACTGKCRPCTPAPAGMIDWWPGNGNAEDVQGSNDGTFQNGATFGEGKVAQAFSLDGVDDYVDVGDVDLPLTFTIDAWVNPTDLSKYPLIVSKDDNGASRSYFLDLDPDGTVVLSVRNTVGDFTQYVTNSPVVSTGSWQHIAVTYDGSAAAGQKMQFYVNGVSAPASIIGTYDNGGTPENNSLSTKIGIFGDGVTNAFPGLIDEVEIFDRVLSQREVQRIYDAGSGGKCPCVAPPADLVAWWPGDGNPYDIQGGDTGTLNGDATFASGEVSQAFSFDGNGDYVEAPNSASLNPGVVTVDAWIKPSDVSGNHNVIFKGNHEYLLQIRNGNVLFGSKDSSGNYAEFQGSLTVPANQWSHVAITHDGSTKRIYVNGALDPVTQSQSGLYTGDTDPLEIGTHHFIQEFFSGLIDEVEIFSRALSQQEIQAIYDAGGAGKCKPSDSDHDGDPDPTDCDDSDPNVHHGATEVCNGKDDNCDGQIDEGIPTTTFYRDADGDGHGDPNVTTQVCSAPSGYVASNDDCDDSDNTVYPGAPEICDGKDNNCDGQIDEGVKSTFYRDADGDGYGDPNVTTEACSAPSGYVTTGTDCDDTDATVHPGATEICDGKDNNCDGQIDEGVKTTFYRDADGDGYGNPNTTTQACSAPSGYVSDNTDCNDSNAAVHPGATELCDGVDNNCSGQIDEGCDTTPPVITVPANITVRANAKQNRKRGSFVSFTVSATDNVDGTVPATANPPSGSFFPIGITTVIVTAEDSHHNSSQKQFTVTVKKKL